MEASKITVLAIIDADGPMVLIAMDNERQMLSPEAAVALSQYIFIAAVKANTAANMMSKLRGHMSDEDIEKVFGGLN